MNPWLGACLALLLAVGQTQPGEKQSGETQPGNSGGKNAKQPPQFAWGVIRSLSVKDGVGTLTILASQGKAAPKEIKFAITGSTKFYWFGKLGPDGRPARQGSPVDVDDVAAGLRKYRAIWVYYTEEGGQETATAVDGHP